MNVRRIRRAMPVAGLALGLALASCTQMVETVPLESTAYSPKPTCHSQFGGYFLPRALLRVRAEAADVTNTLNTTRLDVGLDVVADRRQTLCLDYLALPNSEDVLTVQREQSGSGLLSSISSSAVDKTPEIAEKLIQTAAYTALIRAGSTSPTQPADFADLQFDPFNWEELIAAKIALRRFGYCLYIDGYSFDVDSTDAKRRIDLGRVWCDQRDPKPPSRPTDEFSALPVSPEVMRTGVLYRPNVSFKLVVLRLADPGSREPWLPFQTKRIDMPNISPVLSIGVSRATFATRKTTLLFNKGVLTDVAIDKKSELAGFVSIPLALAKAIVAVPGQIVTLRITDINNETALLAAQSQLLQSIAIYQATLAANGGAPAEVRSGTVLNRSTASPAERRRVELYSACINAGPGPHCTRWLSAGPL